MTGNDHAHADGATNTAEPIGTRRATITSEVDAPETVAAAIGPDDTDEIDTRVEDGRVVTTIERETTGGLEATIDDYVVALDVATTTVEHVATDGPADDDADASEQAPEADEQHANRTDTDTP
ncbi:KEOPS complex subunit Pcc1 [Salinarchaeum chitinilyticum]